MATTEYIRNWRDARRKKAIEALGGACVKCKSTNQLEFDHIDPKTKITNIGRLLTASKAKFDSELKKCQLLCKKCHIEKSRSEQIKPIKHGSLAGYGRHKCRCSACSRVGVAYQVAWKQRNRK